MKISDLQDKTIINIKDGSNIGTISDLEINEEGFITNIYAIQSKFFLKLFSPNKETIFKMEDIKKSGVSGIQLMFTGENPSRCAEIYKMYKGEKQALKLGNFTRGYFYK